MKITAKNYLIDAIIALSVCYKGFENIGGFKKYLDVSLPHLSVMIFSFGLIHGLGLSTWLQLLPIEGPHFLYKISKTSQIIGYKVICRCLVIKENNLLL